MVSQWIYFLILDVLSEVHIIERNVFHILPSAIIWVFVLLLVFLFTGFTRTTVTANLTCACWSRHLPDYLSSIVCCFKLKQSRQLQDESGSTQNALKQTLDGSLAPRLIESWVSLCERWAERVITSWYYGENQSSCLGNSPFIGSRSPWIQQNVNGVQLLTLESTVSC